MGTLREDLSTFLIASRSVLLRMRNVSDKSCRENQNTYFAFSNFFFRKSCRVWDNVERYGRIRQSTDDNIIQRMHFAFWTTKVTDTHSECVILVAFPRQQWLGERATMLRYTRIASLVISQSVVSSTARSRMLVSADLCVRFLRFKTAITDYRNRSQWTFLWIVKGK
jgi:hypothetical protein